MKTGLLQLLGIAAVALGATGTAAAEWTKTYVVEWYEPAMYYGAKAGLADPGTDCPKGTNGEPDWVKVLMKVGYTEQEARWLRDPSHPFRIPNHGQNQMAFRGNDRENIYVNPEAGADPGLVGVTGKIGEGLDLDGDTNTGFVSPRGERGIDNQFYKSLGCWKNYRGPPRMSYGAQSRNDEMREGKWTVAIVVRGEGNDPMNDDKVKIGFYDSSDALVKDGLGEIARNYTFRIQPHARFEGLMDVRTVNGHIVSDQATDEIWLRDPSYTRYLQLLKARVDLEMKPDGTLSGMLGGYRPWKDIYNGWVEARGSVIEQLTWVELPGVWYSLKRNADYSPTGPGGEKTHISTAMRINAIPAYVMTPDARQQATQVASYKSVAPPEGPRLMAFFTNKYRVKDGIVPDSRRGHPCRAACADPAAGDAVGVEGSARRRQVRGPHDEDSCEHRPCCSGRCRAGWSTGVAPAQRPRLGA